MDSLSEELRSLLVGLHWKMGKLSEQKHEIRIALAQMFGYTRPFLRWLIPAGGMLVLGAGVSLGLPYCTGRLIDAVSMDMPPISLPRVALYMIGLMVVHGGLAMAGNLILTWVDERILQAIRNESFAHLQRLPLSFFTSHREGEMISRIGYDVEMIGSATTRNVVEFLQSLLIFAGVLIVMGMISMRLLVFASIGLPLFGVAVLLLGKRAFRLSATAQMRSADMTAHLSQTIRNITLIKSCGTEDFEDQEFRGLVQRAFKTSMFHNLLAALYQPIAGAVAFSATLIVLFVGAGMAQSGDLLPGDLIAFLLYVGMMVAALSSMAGSGLSLTEAAGALSRLFEVLKLDHELEDTCEAFDMRGGLRLRNLSFRYPDTTTDILKGINLDIREGETIVLLGPSGAGKSTLLRIIAGLLATETGEITHLDNGAPVRVGELRCGAMLLEQEPRLLDGSFRLNIGYGDSGLSQAGIEEAAQTANIHDFIAKSTDGYDTMIGEDGIRLSSGQRQRVCLARALANTPSLLLLDEPTNSVDGEGEQRIIDGLRRALRGRTSVIVAHQPWLVGLADRIGVLREGRLVELGTAVELVEKNGYFADLTRHWKHGF